MVGPGFCGGRLAHSPIRPIIGAHDLMGNRMRHSAFVVTASLIAAMALGNRPALADQEGIPALDHVWLIVMENQAQLNIIGNTVTPFLTQLAGHHAQAGNYSAVSHPSLPNYLALVSGSFNDQQGRAIADDASPHWGLADNGGSRYGQLKRPSIADQLQAAGKTWKSYQQSLPDGSAYGLDQTLNPAGGPLYAVKHNPFAYFASVQSRGMANIVDFRRLQQDLKQGSVPNLSFVVPDICHDMHGAAGCAQDDELLQTGDEQVRALYQSITSAPIWQHGHNLIIVVWDEDDYSAANRVPCIVVANYPIAGGSDPTAYSHYSLLRSLEDGFGLAPYLGGAASAKPMTQLLALTAKPK